jgi:hypothetical protein
MSSLPIPDRQLLQRRRLSAATIGILSSKKCEMLDSIENFQNFQSRSVPEYAVMIMGEPMTDSSTTSLLMERAAG